MDERPLTHRIAALDGALSPVEARLAESLLEAAGDLADLTAGGIAARASISPASATRFFRRLGYEDWADLRRQAQRARGAPLDALVEAPDGGTDFARAAAQDIRNLARTARSLPPDAVEAAAERIARARRILVCGFRNSRILADYARMLFVLLRPQVSVAPQAGMTLAEEMAGLGAGDLVIVLGFRRRPPALARLIAAARETGAGTLLIGDPGAAALAPAPEIALLCQSRGAGPFDSYAAAMSLITHLATRVSEREGAPVRARLAQIEALHREIDGFPG